MSFSITRRQLAGIIHSQMQAHHWEKAARVTMFVIRKGFAGRPGAGCRLLRRRMNRSEIDFRHRPH